MYRVLLFILLSHCFYAQMNPVMWQVQNDTIMKWGYFFGDEFNGDQINEDLWHPNYPWEDFRLTWVFMLQKKWWSLLMDS